MFKSNTVRLFLLFLSVIFLCSQELLMAQDGNILSIKQRADSLYDVFAEEQALDLYQRILQENPESYEALWKASFLHARIGNRKEEKSEKENYFREAQSLAGRSLQVDSTEAESHFVMAVAMGRMALISGARDRVAASRSIKKYVDRALAIDSTHAGAWHVLGLWHYNVANLSFIERVAANTLFGGVPGDASNEKAAEAIKKAISYNDQYVLYYHDLALIYDEMGQEGNAIENCKTAIEKTHLTPDDPELKEDCREWLEDWQ